jgi:hypothetical protein
MEIERGLRRAQIHTPRHSRVSLYRLGRSASRLQSSWQFRYFGKPREAVENDIRGSNDFFIQKEPEISCSCCGYVLQS